MLGGHCDFINASWSNERELLHVFLSSKTKEPRNISGSFFIRGVLTSSCHDTDRAEKISVAPFMLRESHSLTCSKAHKAHVGNSFLQ